MEKKRVSILISNFNKENYVEDCINSCLSQKYKNLEIIVVDNNSTDNSLKILNKFNDTIRVEVKNRISTIGAENQIDALIHAFKISSGDLICLLDSDDFFMPKKIQIIEKIFSNSNELKILFDIPRISKNQKIEPIKIKKKYNTHIWPTIIPTSGISLTRNFFNECLKINLFKGFPNVEIDFRLTSFSQKIMNNNYILDDYLTFYRVALNGIMDNSKKFSIKWWLRRIEAHKFMEHFYEENNIKYKKNYDYFITKIITNIIKNNSLK